MSFKIYVFCLLMFSNPLFSHDSSEDKSPLCKTISLKSFHDQYKNQGKVKLVFFASWCASCKEHLKDDPTTKTVFIGAFDSKENMDEVIKTMELKSPCFISKEIVDHYRVEYLPLIKEVLL